MRVDNEAVSMKWEVITEEELNADKGGEAGKDNLNVKPSVSGSPMIQEILVLTCLTVMRRVEMLILTVRTTADYLQEMTAGMMMRSEYHDNLDTNLLFRMSDSVSNATTTQKRSPVAVAGPTQSRKEMFAPPPRPQHQCSSSSS